ncbi:MAG: peptidylprolyl isomerase [Nitrospirae bacterium]|nr:peptidylprolyl isomerase [Nitrospirota bacterium]
MYKFRPLLIFLIVTVLYGAPSANVLLDRVVAVVNQEVITWSELYKNMETDASPQLRELKDEERKKVFRENEAAFLESLINVKLQLHEAKVMGMNVSDDEIAEAIDSIMKKYSMTDSVFRDSLKKEGYSFEEYRKRLKEQILISKIVNQQVRNKIFVSEGEIAKYIDDNKGAQGNEESYKISQIFFKKPKDESEMARLSEKAAQMIQSISGGESFKELAKKYSEDSSGIAGGEIGVISKSALLKEFREALAVMKPGDVSKPFWTERGLHIIRLDEKLEPRGIVEIQEEAKRQITNKYFMEKYNAWIKTLREKAFIEIRL